VTVLPQRDIANVLGERPLVAFGIGRLVEPISPGLILELQHDRRTTCSGPLEMRIDVVDTLYRDVALRYSRGGYTTFSNQKYAYGLSSYCGISR
jgi:hypothetical protein